MDLSAVTLIDLLGGSVEAQIALDRAKMNHLSGLFPALFTPLLHLDAESVLHIQCSFEQEVEAVLATAGLPDQVYWLLGAEQIEIWLNSTKAASLNYRELEELESVLEFTWEPDMATATLEAPVAQNTTNGATTRTEQYYPVEEIAANLSALTRMPADDMIGLILEARPPLKFENKIYKTTPAAGAAAFRQWAARIEAQLEAGQLVNQPSATPTTPLEVKAEKPAAKPTGRPKRTTAKKSTAKKSTAKKSTTAKKTTPKAATES